MAGRLDHARMRQAGGEEALGEQTILEPLEHRLKDVPFTVQELHLGAVKATLRVGAVLALEHGRRVPVFLTTIGAGAFGNRHAWIADAISGALAALRDESFFDAGELVVPEFVVRYDDSLHGGRPNVCVCEPAGRVSAAANTVRSCCLRFQTRWSISLRPCRHCA